MSFSSWLFSSHFGDFFQAGESIAWTDARGASGAMGVGSMREENPLGFLKTQVPS